MARSQSLTASGARTSISALPLHILQSHILNSLDGQSLASLSSVSHNWRSICSEEKLWKVISSSMWPSVAGESVSALDLRYRCLYSDCVTASCPNIKPRWSRKKADYSKILKIISAVDIFCDDQVLYSRDFATETVSDVFLTSPFELRVLGENEKVATPLKFDEEEEECVEMAEARLRVSWILIDPSTKRAFHVAGLKAVEVNRHWVNGFIKLRWATVVASPSGELAQCSVVVTCGGENGGQMQVVDVSLQVENLDGKSLAGMESMVIIGEAMAARRFLSDGKMERDRYREFLKRRIDKREMEELIKKNMDIVIITAVVSILATVVAFFSSAWRIKS